VTKLYNLIDGQDDVFAAPTETQAMAINGLGGNDNIAGGLGNDTLNGGFGNDTLYGGGNGADLVIGGAGNDRLVATSSMNGGSSTLQGGMGDDTYVVGAGQRFTIQENAGEGYDTVRLTIRSRGQDFTMADNVEKLIIDNAIYTEQGGFFDDYLAPSWVRGNSLGNMMLADTGSLIGMSGKGGNDTMYGGVGDDAMYGDDGHDKLLGGAGNDYLNGEGSGTVSFGNDTLDGGLGADRMEGGKGDDTYYVDNVGDKVIEAAGEGTDTVITTLSSYTLGGTVENLTLQGLAGSTGTGNALANLIVGSLGGDYLQGMDGNDKVYAGLGNDTVTGGNGEDLIKGEAGNDRLFGDAGSDTLDGGTGNDVLMGGTGNDVLKGGDGNDVLRGDAGVDHLYGNAGADTFRFGAVTDSPFGGALDAVWDFVKGVDRIDVAGIDADATLAGNQAFGFNATAPMFIDAGTLWLAEANGSTTVYADVNGDGGADFGVFVFGVTGMTASDFIL